MRRHRLIGSVACIGLLMPACGEASDQGEGGTRGQTKRVEFAYRRSCFFGCPLEQPLLAGTRERISVSDAGDVAGLQVESSDEERARFAVERECHCERAGGGARVLIAEDATCEARWRKHCDNTVLVEARAAGEVDLTLRDADDALVDRVALRIAEPSRARFMATLPDQLGADEVTAVELAAEQSAEVELTLYDADGRELLAPEGVDWRMGDPDVATVRAFLTGRGAQVSAGLEVVIDAVAEGETSLAVDVPGFAAELEIRVVP